MTENNEKKVFLFINFALGTAVLAKGIEHTVRMSKSELCRTRVHPTKLSLSMVGTKLMRIVLSNREWPFLRLEYSG